MTTTDTAPADTDTASADGPRFRNLAEVEAAGYVTDEWSRWQQGMCQTYAHALIQAHPHLQMGVSGRTPLGDGDASQGWSPAHFYAHDETHAYDSAGAHPLPYLGLTTSMDYSEHGHTVEDWGDPEGEEGATAQDYADATAHALRHGIGPR